LIRRPGKDRVAMRVLPTPFECGGRKIRATEMGAFHVVGTQYRVEVDVSDFYIDLLFDLLCEFFELRLTDPFPNEFQTT
jgi:hypothetical protein